MNITFDDLDAIRKAVGYNCDVEVFDRKTEPGLGLRAWVTDPVTNQMYYRQEFHPWSDDPHADIVIRDFAERSKRDFDQRLGNGGVNGERSNDEIPKTENKPESRQKRDGADANMDETNER